MTQSYLLVERKGKEGAERVVSSFRTEASLGTSANADITIDDWRCSGIHALIKKNQDDTFTVVDLNTTFGTFYKNRSISKVELPLGGPFRIGEKYYFLKKGDFEQERKKIDKNQRQIKEKSALIEDSMVLSSDKTVLEVSVFWGDHLLEVQQFKRGAEITIGAGKNCTFEVPEEIIPGERSRFTVAKYDKTGLHLQILPACNGLVWVDGKVYNLDSIRLYQNKQNESSGVITQELQQGDEAHMEFGELVIGLRFVRPTKRLRGTVFKKPDPIMLRVLLSVLSLMLLFSAILLISPPEPKEKKLEDIPKHLKKVVYDIGIKNAKKKQQAAVGAIAQSLEGGRARAEEGKASAKKSPKEQKKTKKKIEKKVTEKEMAAKPTPKVAQTDQQVEKRPEIDLEKSFNSLSASKASTKSSILSKVSKSGNSAAAIANGGFASGSKGLGAGGGGSSVGVGALKGRGQGGGMGAGDAGLAPSKGREIEINEREEVVLEDALDPDLIAKIIKRYLPQIQHCYEQQLVKRPDLKGKVKVSFKINGQGKVDAQKVTETTLNDKATESCILQKIGQWKFPRPKGGGVVDVSYPFILMSNNSE